MRVDESVCGPVDGRTREVCHLDTAGVEQDKDGDEMGDDAVDAKFVDVDQGDER
jgi:hypothetical protein